LVKVQVNDKDKLESAIRLMRKKAQKEGIIREARQRQQFEKPCEKRKRKREESKSRMKRKRQKNSQ
jgi:small subunit ribosomal protein S21